MTREVVDARLPSAVQHLEWTRPLQIIRYPDPRLRAPNGRIEKFDDKMKSFAADNIDCMYRG